MPNAVCGVSKIANGDIRVSRFVQLDASRDYAVIEATGTNAPIFGIAHDGSYSAPGLVEALGGAAPSKILAASQGQNVTVYTEEDVCNLLIGSGGCTAGDYIKNDSAAAGVVASAGDVYGAQAMEAANSGELARVVVRTGVRHS